MQMRRYVENEKGGILARAILPLLPGLNEKIAKNVIFT
jgi:hypothetical protein